MRDKRPKKGGRGRMTFAGAAEQALRESKRPLTTAEVLERALDRGLLVTKGKTPLNTMSRELYARLRGTASPIVRLGEPGAARMKRNTVRWKLRGR